MKLLCQKLSERMKNNFMCSLSGSVSENTKVLKPDEFDFIFYVDPLDSHALCQYALRCYLAVHSLIFEDPSQFGSKQLKLESFLWQNQVPKLHFSWNGKTFQNLDISVDLIFCRLDIISKFKRHWKHEQLHPLPASHIAQQNLIKFMPDYLRNGYILAKAVRISSISRPIYWPNLQEQIETNDILTSYILKRQILVENKLRKSLKHV